MKGYLLFRLERLAVAIGLMLAAFVLRWLLDPLLGNRPETGEAHYGLVL